MAFFARAVGRAVARAVISRGVSSMATRGASRRSFTSRSEMRNTARGALRVATRGAFGAASELAEEIGELYEEAGEIVEAAFYEAMDIMYEMCGNAGQESVFFDQVIPAFADEMENTQIGEDWSGVDIGEYMVFMGEIVEAGNAIMEEAFGEAAGLADEAVDAEVELEEMGF